MVENTTLHSSDLHLFARAECRHYLPPQTWQNLVQHLSALAQVQAVLAPQPVPASAPAVLASYQITPRVIRPRTVHNFTVNSIADFADAAAGNGVCQTSSLNGAVCTLCAAIQEANASSGDDTIMFAANVRGTITLGELLVTDSVTITGRGQGIWRCWAITPRVCSASVAARQRFVALVEAFSNTAP